MDGWMDGFGDGWMDGWGEWGSGGVRFGTYVRFIFG